MPTKVYQTRLGMERQEYLNILRSQLALAIEFMEKTPRVARAVCEAECHNHAFFPQSWWVGDMPASPELYDPIDWGKMNYHIWQVWDNYIADLKDHGLHERAELAYALPIYDLLEDDGSEE